MKPNCTLRRALDDPNLLGRALAGDSWTAWRVLLLAIMGEPLSPAELDIFRRFTGRYVSPSKRVRQFWGAIGRRSGKSRAAAVLAAYLGTLVEYPMLVPGERGVILAIAPDQRQASGILSYAAGALGESPILRQRIVRQTSDLIELEGGIVIEVR